MSRPDRHQSVVGRPTLLAGTHIPGLSQTAGFYSAGIAEIHFPCSAEQDC
jgi:hypothetical protein